MGKGKYMAASRSAAVVNFIQQRFTLDDYIAMVEEENVEFLERYPDYEALLNYQREVLADPTTLAFAEYVQAYVENNLLQGMDKEGMTPYVLDGFYYLDGKVFLIIGEQPKLIIKGRSLINHFIKRFMLSNIPIAFACIFFTP